MKNKTLRKLIYSSLILVTLSLSSMNFKSNDEDIIIDSKMTFEESIKGTKAPKSVIDSLCLIDVQYYSFDGKLHQGQVVIDKMAKDDVLAIFNLILEKKFPIGKAIPIVKYNWSDDASMEDNNTSSFCYRFISNTDRLSKHAIGRAIDINPFYNPVVYPDGKRVPSSAKYDLSRNGTFSANNIIVKEFIKRGWRWGGTFTAYKDNHHFDK
jgi:peptidoglycan LD-endopeptidase CwlK